MYKEALENYTKYSNNPIEFIKDNRIGYSTKTFDVRLLLLHDFEKKIINIAHSNQFSAFVKSRQMYMSTLMASYVAWYMIFNTEKTIIIFSPKIASSARFIQIVREILQNYSVDGIFNFEDNCSINSFSELSLKNGCSLKGASNSTDAGKAKEIDLLLVDEASYISNLENIWMSALPCLVAKSGKCIMYSSVNYEDDFFLKVFNDGQQGKNNFITLKVHWSLNPNYNKEWYDEMCKNYLDSDSIGTELDCIPKKRDKQRDVVINFRVDGDMMKKINSRLLQPKDGQFYSMSTYLRELIKKDLG